MGKFLNAVIKAAQADLVNRWNAFDLDKEFASMKKQMNEASKRLQRSAKKLQKHVHNYFDKWAVDVNFNQDEDIISSQIKDNIIAISVTKESNGNTTEFSTTIPDDVDIATMTQKYDPQAKKAIFTFKKKVED